MTRIALALILLAGSTHAQTWTELRPTGEPPTPRNNAAGIYDPIGHRLIVFAGLVPGNITSDVWALDLDQNAWTRLAGPGAGIYDTRGHRFLTFGGGQVGGGGVKSDETWAFDLERGEWSLLQPSGITPPARSGAVAIYIERENRVLMFSGAADEGLLNDVWALEELTPTPTAVEDESWGEVKRTRH